jgi:hypothetical protein
VFSILALFLLAGRLDFASGESSPDRSRLNLRLITSLSDERLSSSSSIKMVIELTVGHVLYGTTHGH